MASLPKKLYPLLLALIIIFSACELPRSGQDEQDITPVDNAPPTLAPLGDNTNLTVATAIPTVLNVGVPTATPSPLERGQNAPDSGEQSQPTAQPNSISMGTEGNATESQVSTEPDNQIVIGEAADNSQTQENLVEEAAIVQEENNSVEQEAPIIVDAPETVAEETAPIASEPPYSGETYTEPAMPTGGSSHVVQSGETLFSIGQSYGVSVDALIYANNLASDIIQEGQVLSIPQSDYTPVEPTLPQQDYSQYPQAPVAPQNPSSIVHTVMEGETLYRIALQYNTSVSAIAQANNLPESLLIYPNQQLIIPTTNQNQNMPYPQQQPTQGYPQQPNQGYPQQQPQYPQESVPQQGYYPQNPQQSPPITNNAQTHTIAPGETLYSIARAYGVTADAIATANGLTDPNQIYVGQVLFLP